MIFENRPLEIFLVQRSAGAQCNRAFRQRPQLRAQHVNVDGFVQHVDHVESQ
jgi:hypothetical protein